MNFKFKGSPIPFGAIFLAAVFTLAIFILLPSLETMREQSRDGLEIRSVDTLSLEPPPPPVEQPEPPPRREMKQADTPKPELKDKKRQMPLNALLDLDFGAGSVEGDFALDFDVGSGVAGKMDRDIFELGEIDRNPMPVVRTPPMYPIQAKMRRIEGKVILEFVVGEDGSVRNIEVVESEPGETFDRAAKRAIANWKFKPGRKDGKPVAVRVRQKLSFKLDQ